MNTQQSSEDTIVAPASAVEGGVAVVRLSGPRAVEILYELFRPAHGQRELPARRMTYGTLHDSSGAPLDDCLAVVMHAPRSFTGEDVAEIHCHGGRAVTTAVMDACLAAGARLAEPGEFSKRAFLNGQMDLAQAEALSDLIAAQTDLARRSALQQLRGGVSNRVRAVRDSLVDAAARIEAHLDFPEEDIPALTQEEILLAMKETETQIDDLLTGFTRGRLIREGARVVLAGSPNAGKSSLFNALVGRERALVSPHPGTTRDTIESTIDLGGIAITLVDTAGLRESADVVEQMGIERTSEELKNADLVLLVVDSTQAHPQDLPQMADTPHLLVLNKADALNPDQSANLRELFPQAHYISAATKQGLDALVSEIEARFAGGSEGGVAQITRARHADCLRLAKAALVRAREAFGGGLSGELVMVDLREALVELGEIIGEQLDEQILDRIFSTFCLGK